MFQFLGLLLLASTVLANSRNKLGAVYHCSSTNSCGNGFHCCNANWCCPNTRICCEHYGPNCCLPDSSEKHALLRSGRQETIPSLPIPMRKTLW